MALGSSFLLSLLSMKRQTAYKLVLATYLALIYRCTTSLRVLPSARDDENDLVALPGAPRSRSGSGSQKVLKWASDTIHSNLHIVTRPPVMRSTVSMGAVIHRAMLNAVQTTPKRLRAATVTSVSPAATARSARAMSI